LHTLLLVLASIAALYASAMWLTGKSQHETLPFWIVALASFAITCALNDRAETSRVWGVALLLSGGVLFLFDPPIRRIRFLPLLGLIGLSALPYTLAASGWNGLLGEKFTLSGAVMLLSHALLVLGFIRTLLKSAARLPALKNTPALPIRWVLF
jgi:hypothetical protein